jgi:hypothetical protein
MIDAAELIARAIAELEGCGCRICTLARDALAAQAQEIEQAKRDAATERTLRLSLEGERNAAEARVRELKDEIDRLQTVICCEQDRRDAIEAATIERCAKLADGESLLSIGVSPSMERIEIATAIRALAKQPLTSPPL